MRDVLQGTSDEFVISVINVTDEKSFLCFSDVYSKLTQNNNTKTLRAS